MEGQRAEAVRRAQREGRYEQLAGIRVVEDFRSSRRLVLSVPGGRESVPLDGLGPAGRLRLFRRTDGGLEPLALWLNQDGMPRRPPRGRPRSGQRTSAWAGLACPGSGARRTCCGIRLRFGGTR